MYGPHLLVSDFSSNREYELFILQPAWYFFNHSSSPEAHYLETRYGENVETYYPDNNSDTREVSIFSVGKTVTFKMQVNVVSFRAVIQEFLLFTFS